jgi:4-hydroxybenzoate polyprenyltransferase
MTTAKHYLSLVKFSHTIFAMPFAFIGFFLGIKHEQQMLQNVHSSPWYVVYWPSLAGVLVCMITARNAAMAYNRYLDRHFDALNPRTAIREIPQGIISPQKALRFVIVNCLVFITATFFINRICFYLSPVALFVILFYSYTKRFTALCHLVLGIGLSLAPIGAFLAVTGAFHILPILFSLSVVFWVSGFDIIFALQDVAFDTEQQLYSIPSVLGKTKGLLVSKLLHLASAAFVVAAGFLGSFHVFYWIGVSIFCGMLVYQHSIVKPTDLSRVNIAFMTANGIASVVFGAFTIADILAASIVFT